MAKMPTINVPVNIQVKVNQGNPLTASPFRAWCIGGPYDCQWINWPAINIVIIPNPTSANASDTGTYMYVLELQDDEGKYRVYQWIGWDPVPRPMSTAIGISRMLISMLDDKKVTK